MTMTMTRPCIRLLGLLTLMAALTTVSAEAGSVSKEFPFHLDEWYELGVTDGPVTLHRIRVEAQAGNVKSKIFRPTNSEFAQTVQVQIEYTNTSDDDHEADVEVVWVDAKGQEIDGYRGEEGIDEDEKKDEMTMTFSTLKYGLEQAKTLKVEIRF